MGVIPPRRDAPVSPRSRGQDLCVVSLASGQLRQLAPVRFLLWVAPAEEENADTQKDEGGAGNAEPKKEQGERNAPHGLQREEQLLALERGPIETGGARPRVITGLLPASVDGSSRAVSAVVMGATSFSRGVRPVAAARALGAGGCLERPDRATFES